jgi:type II pantothenate kinase
LQVVLVANSLPAINDVTAAELRSVVAKAAEACPIIRAARDAAVAAEAANHGRIPPVPGHHGHHGTFRTPSPEIYSSPSQTSVHEELPAARSATGFAFSPAPRRGYPISGSSLLGAPLPTGSPLADVLLSPPPEPSGSSGASALSSPLRRPPLPPSAAQLQQQLHGHHQLPTSPPEECGIGASEAVQRAIAALEAAELGRGHEDASAEQPAAGSQPAEAPAAAAGGAAATAAGPPAALQHSRSGSGEMTPTAGEEAGPSGSNSGEPGGASWRQQRQLGGHRRRSPSQRGRRQKGMFGESYPSPWRDPRLFIAASGHGSPCLDLRRLSSEVADAAAGTDLVVIEGMGRAIHTNYYTRLQCDTLKLAMIKNKHLAQSLFRGDVYDCVCRFDEGMDT